MTTITFTIHGNQEHPNGNPIPYFRTTQAGQWTKGAKRYHAWKDYVKKAWSKAGVPKEYNDELAKKPIPATKEKIRMTIKIYWMNRAHADCDNVFKGIADALFMNDKYLVSDGFDYEYCPEKRGRVEVTITL